MQAIELFAGAGGLGLGVGQAGFKPVMIAEWDHWSCENLRLNKQRGRPLHGWPMPEEKDVRSLSYLSFCGKVALISGGPPCQPFSMGGKHRAHEDRRDMWPEAVRAVREARPQAFLFENVKGLTRQSFATYVSYVELQLKYPSLHKKTTEDWAGHLARLQQHELGRPKDSEEYRVIFFSLNAADYGVPQRRERVMFVGFRSDLEISWSPPKPSHSSEALIWAKCRDHSYWDKHRIKHADRIHSAREMVYATRMEEKPNGKPWVTTRDAICDLPNPELGECQISNHKHQAGARSYPGHTGSPLDEPAKTLKAGVHGVPGGENMLVKSDGSVRYFTVRESARLQTFPDSYLFGGSWTESMRQLGNAVPVKLAKVVAADIAKRLRNT
ncbi:MAG: DNA cytosine methyltransferase [Rhizobiales bacterium]|nr:DNA cytosine methyltransferase [Hyphomicrobiales bacterium]